MFAMTSPAASTPVASNGLAASTPVASNGLAASTLETAAASMKGFSWRATFTPVAPAAVARLAAAPPIWCGISEAAAWCNPSTVATLGELTQSSGPSRLAFANRRRLRCAATCVRCSRRPTYGQCRFKLAASPFGPPTERRFPFRIQGCQDQPAQQSQVLEEMHPLLIPGRIIRLLPEAVTGIRGRNDRTDQGDRRQAWESADGQETSSAHLHSSVEPHQGLRIVREGGVRVH